MEEPEKNLFKINNKDTRTSIVNFEHISNIIYAFPFSSPNK